jgi:hypothetical protein
MIWHYPDSPVRFRAKSDAKRRKTTDARDPAGVDHGPDESLDIDVGDLASKLVAKIYSGEFVDWSSVPFEVAEACADLLAKTTKGNVECVLDCGEELLTGKTGETIADNWERGVVKSQYKGAQSVRDLSDSGRM